MVAGVLRRRRQRYSTAQEEGLRDWVPSGLRQEEGLRDWVPSGLRQAEQLYCVLFFVGWALVFGPFVAQALVELGEGLLPPKLLPEGLKSLWVPRSRCYWEVATGALQLMAHVAWYCTLLFSANGSSPLRWCSCFASGFVVPLGILGFGLLGKNYLHLPWTEHLPNKPFFPWFGPLHRMFFYQVGWWWHCGLLMIQTIVEGVFMVQDRTYGKAFMKLFVNFVLPLALPHIIEAWSRPEHLGNSTGGARKHVCAAEPESSLDTASQSRPLGSTTGVPSESVAPLQEDRVAVERKAGTHARDPRTAMPTQNLAMDVSEILRSPCGDRSSKNLLHYESVVRLKPMKIKVYKENATDREIQQYAEKFVANLSQKKKEVGKLTLVKGIGIRGCVLLVAGMLDSTESTSRSFQDEATEVLDCLPTDLRLEDMDITLKGMTGRIVSGELQSVERVDCNVDVPEVTLVMEPCAIKGRKSTVEVYFSPATDDWTSMNAVTMMDDAVSQEVLLCGSKSQHIILTIEGTSNHQNGHIRAIGVLNDRSEGPGTTFVGSMTPLLVLPKGAAHELNGLFTNTVIADGRDDLESRKRVWQEYFRQFSLDMYYVLEFATEELSDLMIKNPHMKQEYTKVLCNVIKFLHECDATQAVQYLLNLVEGAGIKLIADGKSLSEQLGLYLDDEDCESVTEAGPSMYMQAADEQEGKIKGKLTAPVEPGADIQGSGHFSWWKGFADPTLETHYRAHHRRKSAATDILGTVMGMCLVPLMWHLVRQGKALYLSPVITQFFICNIWRVLFWRTYVHNRQPVMILHWLVRLVAFVAQSAHEGWPSLSMPGIWNYLLALLFWTVVIKPRVMKMLLRDHIIFSLCDFVSWVAIVVVNFLCNDVMSGIIPAVIALSGTVFSCVTVFWAEQADRKMFASKFGSQLTMKSTGSKH